MPFGIITIFLIVLTLALVIGNVLLYLSKPRNKKLNELKNLTNSSANSNIAFVPNELNSNNLAQLLSMQSNFKALNGKINMALQKLAEVESRTGSSFDATVLSKKLDSFEDFKNETRIEIAALKQFLQKTPSNNVSVKKSKNEKELSKTMNELNKMDKKIHAWAYNRKK